MDKSEDNPQANKIPTNDEIVEDLVKDFEINNTVEDDNIDTKNQPSSHIPDDFERDNEESSRSNKPIPDDYIDEELLAQENSSLTEEEKLENKTKASKLKVEGNDQFRAGQYLDSIKTYTEALKLCPLEYTEDRSVYYCNRSASKIQIANNESALDDCSKAIELNDKYIRAFMRRAKLYEESSKLDESFADYKKVVELDPGNKEAYGATMRLPPLINEKNEKTKAEMLGKLKEVGNLFLKPFGLSTDNFQMQQNPDSGGYSINFKQGGKP